MAEDGDDSSATSESGPPPPAPAPDHMPLYMSAIYIAASVLLWSTRGLSMYFISANTQQIQGSLGATLTETTWLVAAYMAPFASLTILLLKIRTQFGLRRFCEVAIVVFLIASLLHLFIYDVRSAIPVRFIAGAAAVPISSIGFLYMLEAFPPDKKRTWGLSLALTCSGAAGPFARLISPMLFDLGDWRQLYLLEIGLALACLAVVYVLPLTQIPRAKVLHWLDFVAYGFIAVGFGALAVALVQGKNYWWLEAPWIGVCLAVSILSLAIAAAIEINRKEPLMNLQWLMSPEILRFSLALLVFRIVLAEQTTGAIGFFQTFGLQDAQSQPLYLLILAASFAGGAVCGALLQVERVPFIFGFALLCICAGAFLDSHATNLTRPHNVYLSQALIAFGGALFLPSSMLAGISKATRQGPAYMTSFIVVFLFTQNIGGLIGSALFSTFITIREKYHSAHLVEHLVMADPIVAQRVQVLSGTYAKVLADQGLTKAEGLVLLAQQTTREATVLSYNDAFLAIAVIAGVALCCQLFYIVLETWRAKPLAPAAAN